MSRSSCFIGVVAACVSCVVGACAVGGADGNGEDAAVALDAAAAHDASASNKKDAQAAPDATTTNTNDAGALDAATADVPDVAPPKPIVYGHSPDTLYTFDVTTQAITEVAPFSGCTQTVLTQVIDLAIDSQMNAYATTFDGLYAVSLANAQCALIKAGSYPNSLSFVPAGVLDPNLEVLVGYFGSSYVRIDTTTGATTSVGTLSGGYASSGDVVSVAGGGTFLTVTGNGCGDCLLQVNPQTGDVVQSYGALPHGAVYGLGYWAGSLYGFDQSGDLFSIGSGADGGLTTSDVVLDGGVMWWGAGSTTIAPATASDGGTIATQ